MEGWARQGYLADSKHTADTVNGHGMGKCELLQELIDLKADALLEEEND